MKRFLTSYDYVSLFFVIMSSLSARECCDCRSIFIPRSTGDDLVRQATYHTYEDTDCSYVNLGAEYRFQRSFESCRISKSLFGTSILHFQGTNIKAGTLADEDALIADNFGLSPNTDSSLLFAPTITNNIVDFQLFIGFDSYIKGLFLQLNLPYTHSSWKLRAHDTSLLSFTTTCRSRIFNICENDCATARFAIPAQEPFNAGCMGNFTNPTPPALPATVAAARTIESALSGDFLFGDMQEPWTAGRFDFLNGPDRDASKLASVNLILGYNIYECQNYNFGCFIRACAPTGTEDSSCCITRNVFEPHIGDNHWKLGGGLTGHYDLYTCNDAYSITMYYEGYAEHLFKRCQARSFDFKDKGCLSRYMLLKEFNSDNSYAGNLINGINFTTRKIETTINVQGEGILEFVYNDNCGFSAGLGWNIYGHSKEKACSLGGACNADINGKIFGFKGCSSVQGQCVAVENSGTTISSPLTITSTNLNSTQSNATITTCGDVDNPFAITQGVLADNTTMCLDGCSINSTPLVEGAVVSLLNNITTPFTVTITDGANPAVVENLAATSQLHGEAAPVIIDPATALDINSGLLKSQLTNKLFGHFDYAWLDHCWTPQVYIGVEVEIAGENHCQTMNAWAVYLGGSLTY